MTLDQTFDANTLRELRKAVLAEATRAGMPGDRAVDVMLAVHELAANTVVHGGGAGQARMRVGDGELHCMVSDAGPGTANGGARGLGAGAESWVVRPGHGLWLVRNAADHFSVASGLGGSRVTAVFTLPRQARACLADTAGDSRNFMRVSEIAHMLRVARPPAPHGAKTLARCYSIEDVARQARRRLPLGSRAYLETGGEDEYTLRRNRAAFDNLEFLPSQPRDVSEVDTSTRAAR